MHIRELPSSVPVAISAQQQIIALALQSILLPGHPSFRFHGPIPGGPRSGRIFTLAQAEGLAPANHKSCTYWAHQLIRLIPQARYDPAQMPGGIRAWEIRHTSVHNMPAAIAWATWMV